MASGPCTVSEMVVRVLGAGDLFDSGDVRVSAKLVNVFRNSTELA